MGERDEDGDGDVMVVSCTFSLEVVELVGSGYDLASGLDDFVAGVLVSTLSVDLTSALADQVVVILSNLAVIGSAHHFL